MSSLLSRIVAKGTNLVYIELFDTFLGSDGLLRADLFVADRLHHNAKRLAAP